MKILKWPFFRRIFKITLQPQLIAMTRNLYMKICVKHLKKREHTSQFVSSNGFYPTALHVKGTPT